MEKKRMRIMLLLGCLVTSMMTQSGLVFAEDQLPNENEGTTVSYEISPEVLDTDEQEIIDESTPVKNDKETTKEQSEANQKGIDSKAQNTLLGAAVPNAQDVVVDETTFPDAAFRNAVLTNIVKSGTTLTTTMINNAKTISFEYLDIEDFTGIEYFTAATQISIRSNKTIKKLDLSKNTALKKLYISNNTFESDAVLDVSKNTNLEYLDCAKSKLESLDVSGNPNLTYLDCEVNKLTQLDVTKNTKLSSFYCRSNNLTSLDLRKNTALVYLKVGRDNLAGGGYNKFTTLDVSANTLLKEINFDYTDLETIDLSNNVSLESLYGRCNSAGKGLTSLDVTKNPKLSYMTVSGNRLKTLDLSKQASFTTLNVSSNQLLALSIPATVSSFTGNKQVVNVESTDGTYDLSNYDATFDKTKISNIQNATLNGNVLSGFNDNDVTFDYAVNATKKINVKMVVDKQYIDVNEVNFPDADFKQFLEDTFGTIITKDDVANTTSLDCSGLGIKSLEGIDVFTSLTTLDCSNNHILSLNLPQSVTNFNGTGQTLAIETQDLTYELSDYDAAIDANKISQLTHAKIDGTKLKEMELGEVTYLYDCGNSKSLYVTLSVTGLNDFKTTLSMDNWVYGNTASKPVCSTYFGTLKYVYSTSSTGIYTDTKPTQVGTYYVKAIVEAGIYYNGLESTPVQFTITKGIALPIPELPPLKGSSNNKLSQIYLPKGWQWADKNAVLQKNNNQFKVRYTVDDSNYDYTNVEGYVASGHYIEQTITVQVKDNFLVEFDFQGGQFDGYDNPWFEVIIEEDKLIDMYPHENFILKEGYVFTGWYTEKECINIFDILKDTVKKDMKLYAGWKLDINENNPDQPITPSKPLTPEGGNNVSKQPNTGDTNSINGYIGILGSSVLLGLLGLKRRKASNKE